MRTLLTSLFLGIFLISFASANSISPNSVNLNGGIGDSLTFPINITLDQNSAVVLVSDNPYCIVSSPYYNLFKGLNEINSTIYISADSNTFDLTCGLTYELIDISDIPVTQSPSGSSSSGGMGTYTKNKNVTKNSTNVANNDTNKNNSDISEVNKSNLNPSNESSKPEFTTYQIILLIIALSIITALTIVLIYLIYKRGKKSGEDYAEGSKDN